MNIETVLITGASSGIGEVLAKKFGDGGYNLVLVARSKDKLDVLAQQIRTDTQSKVWVEPADLSSSHAATKLSTNLTQRLFWQVSILALTGNNWQISLGK